ncbi:mechanosensitive ion channel family protein [Spirochaeta isovalerica]|uniref:Small-conductance mechanosensitive channel n=1 Tax=Spirochaeta isovalerica TaxID=150 RepID=A0A841R5E0_9SPIO|nr:mechanosensitive ion channel domain-containing protein [Spirochaeta isovalerica]MBB6478377.1 small-conductance mechanosensitive channel [Spirochaeta isovalerica]
MAALEILRDIFFKDISLGTFNLPFSISDVLLKVLLPLIAVIITYRVILLGLKHLMKVLKVKEELAVRISSWSRRIFRVAAFFAGIALIGSLLGTEIAFYIGQFINLLNQPFFETGNTKISLVTLLMLIPVFWAASWGGKYTRVLLDRSFIRNLNIDEARKFSIGSMTRYAVMAVIVLFGLSIIGIDLSALGVLFGVLGIGLGFGLQGTVANFFAGLVLISTGYVKEKDRIVVNNSEGTVISIKMLSTIVSTVTHENLIIPNSHLMENVVHNYSFDDRKVVIINKIQVSYDSDLDRVLEIMVDTVKESPYLVKSENPVARVHSFDDSGITMKLISWINDSANKYEFLGWVNLELWRAFKKEGIEIPYPQLDLHVKKEKGEPELPV